MYICTGERGAHHDDIVIDGDCPACAFLKEIEDLKSEVSAAQDAQYEAEQALAKFETDLVHAMKMIKRAKEQAEAEL